MINFNRQSKQCTDCFVVMERCRMFSFKRRKRNVSIVANNYCDYCFMESILGVGLLIYYILLKRRFSNMYTVGSRVSTSTVFLWENLKGDMAYYCRFV